MGRIIVGKTADIPPGKMQKIAADGKEILIVNVNGNFYAINDTCTHAGASLSEGVLDGCTITCGWHGAKFDCQTGKLLAFPAKIKDLQSYKVVVESDNIFLEV
ncbi:MAG: non-heme iron oxygenase ferredoxin subunit [Patescibacteria group bacterium]|nr:non-heme iron oxygenase ferredoxin subunit [Nitrososphaerota archaeon]MDE2589066.1 non-heme iron oxygenase ferredoxin subunit [Patescibacteria group bacterium]